MQDLEISLQWGHMVEFNCLRWGLRKMSGGAEMDEMPGDRSVGGLSTKKRRRCFSRRAANLLVGSSMVLAGVAMLGHGSASANALSSTVFAGGGANPPSLSPQSAVSANLSSPADIVVDSSGDVYIADTASNLVEMVTPGGQLSIVAGGGANAPSLTPQTATSVTLTAPNSLAIDGAGDLFIGESAAQYILKVTPAGQLTVFTGAGTDQWWAHGVFSQMQLSIGSLAADGSGNVYVSFWVIMELATDGTSPPLAGGGSTPLSTSPTGGLGANIGTPTSMAVDGSGNLYFTIGNTIAKISSGQVSIVAGGGSNAPSATPQSATSVALSSPSGLAVDSAGVVYFVNSGDIDKIATDGQLSLVAHAVCSSSPASLAVDASENIYAIGSGNTIVKVSASSTPSTSTPSTSTPSSTPPTTGNSTGSTTVKVAALASTGANSGLGVLGGLILMGLGVTTLIFGRRRSASASI